MYRDDGFRYTPRPPPSPPNFVLPDTPVETLPQPDPGGMPDYQRRFPVVPGPPVRGVPLPGPLPAPPGGRWPRTPRVPIGTILNAAMLAEMATLLLQPMPTYPANFAGGGGWFRKCGPTPWSLPYMKAIHHQYFNTASASPTLCGLGGQAFSNVDNAPTTSSKSLILFYGPNPNLLPAERWLVFEVWSRPANGAVPGNYPTVRNQNWTTRPTFPGTVTLPAVEGTIPLHIPYSVLPYWGNTPFREVGNEIHGNQDVRSATRTAGATTTTVDPVTGVDTDTDPDLPYRPHPSVAHGIRTRERKFNGNAFTLAVWRVVDTTTEGNDFIRALFKALPPRRQREFHRWFNQRYGDRDNAGWYVYHRTLWTIRHFNEIDINEAIGNVIMNQIEDRIWGAYFAERSRQSRQGRRFGPYERGRPRGFVVE